MESPSPCFAFVRSASVRAARALAFLLAAGALGATGFAAPAAADAPAAPAGFRWDADAAAHRYALVRGSGVVWRFNANPACDSKPYFDPLAVAGGPSLTLPRPADHPWHLGHWFSWKYINGVNYWEEDRAGHAAGITEWDAPAVELRADASAAFTLQLRSRPRPRKGATATQALLAEQRKIAISAPAADGSYALDWTQEFTALADVKFDRTPVPGEKGGVTYGGYAGLSVRFSNALTKVNTVASTVGRTRYDKRKRMDVFGDPAVEQNGEIDGSAYGIALLPHPAAPRAGDWYLIEVKNFTYTNSAFLLKAPFTLKRGGTLRLRHRVIVHPERWTARQLKTAAAAYAAEVK
jgi:hypothetical protein